MPTLREPPALSVVVAASDSAGAVARTLDALARQRGAGRIEVIVAAPRDRFASPTIPPSSRPFQGLHWINAEPGAGVPRLRRLGLDRATSPLVVFTEDSCQFGPGWAEAWVRAFGDPRVQAATGPVEPAMGHAATDWAVFFCEYAPFLMPRRGGVGPSARLAGNNFAVRRDSGGVLDRAEIHETEVARALADCGGGLVVVEAAGAGHVRRYSPRQAIADRLRFGQSYGRQRARSWPPMVRLAGCFAGPLILGVQVARLAAIVLARRRHLGRFVEALPITLALLSAWSVGEWLGWLSPLGPVRGSARVRRKSRFRLGKARASGILPARSSRHPNGRIGMGRVEARRRRGPVEADPRQRGKDDARSPAQTSQEGFCVRRDPTPVR